MMSNIKVGDKVRFLNSTVIVFLQGGQSHICWIKRRSMMQMSRPCRRERTLSATF